MYRMHIVLHYTALLRLLASYSPGAAVLCIACLFILFSLVLPRCNCNALTLATARFKEKLYKEKEREKSKKESYKDSKKDSKKEKESNKEKEIEIKKYREIQRNKVTDCGLTYLPIVLKASFYLIYLPQTDRQA